MREPKPAWITALRALTGVETDTIRFNEEVWRWEFVLQGADGVPRSQFFGWFDKPVDPVTGMHPFRELDDQGFREVMRNLEMTFVGNPFDGAGTTRKEVWNRYRTNKMNARKKYKQAGEDFADRVAGMSSKGRDAGFSGYGGPVAAKARKAQKDTATIEIVTPIGAGGGTR